MTNLLEDFFMWDTLLHTLSGFFLAYIGYKLIKKINLKTNRKTIIIFSICFSMTIAVIWEFIEFTSDTLFLNDMQTDRIIENLGSIKISSNDDPLVIKNIDHTILYDSNSNEIIRINGYLDIGIIDTMKDLFVNFIGSITFSLICYLVILKKEKYK